MTVQYRLVTDALLCAIAKEIHYVDYNKPDDGYWCHGEYHTFNRRITQAEMVIIMETKLEGPILLKTLKHRKHRSNETIDIKKRRFRRGPSGFNGSPGPPGPPGIRGDTGMVGQIGLPGEPSEPTSNILLAIVGLSSCIVSIATSAVITFWLTLH